jgi:hypothetical protein
MMTFPILLPRPDTAPPRVPDRTPVADDPCGLCPARSLSELCYLRLHERPQTPNVTGRREPAFALT